MRFNGGCSWVSGSRCLLSGNVYAFHLRDLRVGNLIFGCHEAELQEKIVEIYTTAVISNSVTTFSRECQH